MDPFVQDAWPKPFSILFLATRTTESTGNKKTGIWQSRNDLLQDGIGVIKGVIKRNALKYGKYVDIMYLIVEDVLSL